MHQSRSIFRIFYFIIALSGTSLMQSMEFWDIAKSFGDEDLYFDHPSASAKEQKQYSDNAQAAQEYNNTLCPLTTTLTNDALCAVFSHCHFHDDAEFIALDKSMQYFRQMSFVCKKFNHILSLQMIGEFCKKYSIETKNHRLLGCLKAFHNPSWRESMKTRASILIFADADANVTTEYQSDCLLRCAILYNDYDFAKILCEHKANPNICTSSLGYSFFYAKTKKMAELFVAHGLNVHATNDMHSPMPNVLWKIADYEYPADLMAYYLELGVNPNLLWEGGSLLHRLAGPLCLQIGNIEDFFKKAEMLLDAMPDMINHQNKQGKTALDCAYNSLRLAKQIRATPEAFEQFIALLRKHGAFRAQELKQQKTKVI